MHGRQRSSVIINVQAVGFPAQPFSFWPGFLYTHTIFHCSCLICLPLPPFFLFCLHRDLIKSWWIDDDSSSNNSKASISVPSPHLPAAFWLYGVCLVLMCDDDHHLRGSAKQAVHTSINVATHVLMLLFGGVAFVCLFWFMIAWKLLQKEICSKTGIEKSINKKIWQGCKVRTKPATRSQKNLSFNKNSFLFLKGQLCLFYNWKWQKK